MKLYVMRHGPAEDRSASGLDSDRALTTAGRHYTAAVCRALTDAGEAPSTILTSPLVRAVETAEIVADVAGLGPRGGAADARAGGIIHVRRELGMGVDKLPLLRELVRSGEDRVMVVGHDPDLSSLIALLLGPVLGAAGFAKAMVVAVEPELGPGPTFDVRARLGFILNPATLTWRYG